MGEASVRDGGECLGVGWDVEMQDGGCQEGRGQDVKRSGAVGCGSAPPQDPEWIRREKEREEGIYSVLSLVQLGNSD